MNIKEIRNLSGLSQAEFAEKYDVPLNTLKGWESNETSSRYRNCPVYVEKLLERVVKEDVRIQNLPKQKLTQADDARFRKIVRVLCSIYHQDDMKEFIKMLCDDFEEDGHPAALYLIGDRSINDIDFEIDWWSGRFTALIDLDGGNAAPYILLEWEDTLDELILFIKHHNQMVGGYFYDI